MEEYKKMYLLLFNAITDALEQMEQQNYGTAKDLLITAQQKAEEIYITAESSKSSSPARGERSNAAGTHRSLPPSHRHTRPTE